MNDYKVHKPPKDFAKLELDSMISTNAFEAAASLDVSNQDAK